MDVKGVGMSNREIVLALVIIGTLRRTVPGLGRGFSLP